MKKTNKLRQEKTSQDKKKQRKIGKDKIKEVIRNTENLDFCYSMDGSVANDCNNVVVIRFIIIDVVTFCQRCWQAISVFNKV